MTYSVTRTYRFEAAHFLPKVPETHKCRRVHGHNYRVDVTVAGPLDDCGFVIDFFHLDAQMAPLIESMDHRCLNDISGLENPTAELIAQWVWKKLGSHQDTSVKVFETADACAEFTP